MTALKSKDTFKQADDTASTIQGGISKLVRSEVAEQRWLTPDAMNAQNVEGLSSLISRVAGRSAEEIDELIEELNGLRNFLRTEGQRIDREICQYVQMHQSAKSSIQMIGGAFEPLKRHFDKQPASGALAPAQRTPDDCLASADGHVGSALPNQP